MDTNSKSWNGDLVKQFFSEDITTSILNTSLFNQVLNDRLVWKAEKNGKYIYSVQSAYRLCVEDLVDMQRQRPTLGHLKCNIDASFLQSMNRVGIAICVRDNDEAFVLVKTMSFSPLRSVLLVIL